LELGLSSLLLFEELPAGVIPVYDIDHKAEVVYATKNGAARVVSNRRYVGNFIEEDWSNANFSDKQVIFDKAVERMLTEILLNTGVFIEMSEIGAVKFIESQDLKCSRVLTKNDLTAIPDGMALSICSPEYLGRIYAQRWKWGAFIFNLNGIVLFNINADITKLENVVLNFVKNCIKNGQNYDKYYSTLNDVKKLLLESNNLPSLKTEELLKEQIIKQIHNL
jgi:hypothetical protein